MIVLATREHSSGAGTYFEFAKERSLKAHVLDPFPPTTNGAFLHALWAQTVDVVQDRSRRAIVPQHGDFEHPKAARAGESLRVLTGRVDPANAGRLLVDYTLDGKAGTVAFTLGEDDRLRFEPDRGTVNVNSFDGASGRVAWMP